MSTSSDMLCEIHITLDKKDAEKASELATSLHWKTSQIDGDPVLGAKPFFYLTTHTKTADTAFSRMALMVTTLQAVGIPILREKIEVIIYDKRF